MFTSCRWLTIVAVLVGLAPLSAQADATQYLPKNTEVIISFNLNQLLTSQLAKDNKEAVEAVKGLVDMQLDGDAKYAKMQKETGFDLLRDLTSVTLGMDSLKKNPKDVIVVLEGQFNEQKIRKAATGWARENADMFKLHTIGDRLAVEITRPGKDESGFVVLVNGNTLLMTKSREQVQAALGQNQVQPAVSALLKTQPRKTCLTFLATNKALNDASQEAKNPQAQLMLQQLAPKIEGMTFSATLENELKFQVGIPAKTAEFAQELAKQMEEMVKLGKFFANNQAQNNPQIAPVVEILDSMRANNEGTHAYLQGRISNQTLVDLLQKWQNMAP